MTNKIIDSFVVISRFNEDVSWIREYTDNYIIYNKGEDLPLEFKSKKLPNFGGNQHDMFLFIYENYDCLPETMIFLQAYPFDHCNKEKFNKIINNKIFTSVESTPSFDEGYFEHNNCGYIESHNNSWGLTCKFNTFDDFMNSVFKDYIHEDVCKFSPGSQYIIEKKQALRYSKLFWNFLINSVSKTIGINGGTESHVVERGMSIILSGKYNPVDDLG